MAKVLVLLGSPSDATVSASSQVAMHFVEKYKQTNPNDEVEIVNISENKVSSFTKTILSGTPTAEDFVALEARGAVLAKFKAADKIVLAAPMWNYSLPGFVKEYIDCFFVAGETFKYLDQPDENGSIVKGLAAGKKMLFIQSMGGVHKGTEGDIGYKQITQMFDFIGINDVTYVAVQGAAIPGMTAVETAASEVDAIVSTF